MGLVRLFVVALPVLLSFATVAQAKTCIECHKEVTPLIVADWKAGAHSKKDIGCAACHSDKHKTSDDVPRAQVPTPDTCAACHEKQVKQFKAGKHSLAWLTMTSVPVAHWQLRLLTEGVKGCAACHKVGLKSEDDIKALRNSGFLFGNASCDSCHSRHSFSIREARQPEACQTCHSGGDHAQWEMYSGSKHGVRYAVKQSRAIPEDSVAPTCQSCHMNGGDHAVKTAWGFFGLRLPLPDDPEWAADRRTILGALQILDKEGKPANGFGIVRNADVMRLTEEEWQKERDRMLGICRQCHSGNFAKAEYEKSEQIIRVADRLLAQGIRNVEGLYELGLLDSGMPSIIQQRLSSLFEQRMRTIHGAFHANPEYSIWLGWSEMQRTLVEISEMARDRIEEGGDVETKAKAPRSGTPARPKQTWRGD